MVALTSAPDGNAVMDFWLAGVARPSGVIGVPSEA